MSNTTQSSTSPGGIDVSSAFPGLDTTRRDSLRMGILNVNIVFMALITLTVSLRTYSRVRVLRHWGWDDGMFAPLPPNLRIPITHKYVFRQLL